MLSAKEIMQRTTPGERARIRHYNRSNTLQMTEKEQEIVDIVS